MSRWACPTCGSQPLTRAWSPTSVLYVTACPNGCLVSPPCKRAQSSFTLWVREVCWRTARRPATSP